MKKPMPSLNALRAFEAAARLGRMTLAAEELSVTHGAVSRQIRYLEDLLDVKLFEGSKNRPVLSEAGKTLLPGLSAGFAQIENALATVQKQRSHSLDISCFGSFMIRLLIPKLYHFREMYPEIDIRLSAADRWLQSTEGKYDVMIALDEPYDSDQYERIILFPEELGPVLTPSLLDKLQLQSPEDLPQKLLLHTKTRTNAWPVWFAKMNIFSSEFNSAEMYYDHYYFTLEAAIAGLGICLAPKHLVLQELRANTLIAPFGFVKSGFHYVANYRRNHTNARLFSTWLQGIIQDQ